MITKEFPKFEEITSKELVEVWLDNIFQYTIGDKVQLNNIRLWAKVNNAENRILFKWTSGEVKIERNKLIGDTVGFLRADIDSGKALLFDDNPTEYFI